MSDLGYLIFAVFVIYFFVLPLLRGLRRGEQEKQSARRRDTVQELIDSGKILFPAAVHGESFYQANIRRVAAVGKAVNLVPEPANPYDRNAVRVDVDGLTIGYIPRDQAERAKDEEWKAIIAAVNSGRKATGIVLGITQTYREHGTSLNRGIPEAGASRRARFDGR